MEDNKNYEKKAENIEGIPLTSRRSAEEISVLEFVRLREEIEEHYKQIRDKKARLEKLVSGFESVRQLDSYLRKIPRKEEEKKRKREETARTSEEESGNESGAPTKKKKLKNAIQKKKQVHRSYLRQGYTMTEQEIRSEGGEVGKQFVYFKDLGDGKSSTHVMKGIEGLQLSSNLGEGSKDKMEE